MFKLTVFILSFTILAQSASFDIIDITKFSTFFTHINNHIDDGDDFADFIDLHYGNKIDLHQNKHKEHKELPFKHQHIDSNLKFVFVLVFFWTVLSSVAQSARVKGLVLDSNNLPISNVDCNPHHIILEILLILP